MARDWLTRHPRKTLTNRFVQSVTEPGKYFDGHGLYLRVGKTSGRSWVQRIVIRGRRRELGLGSAELVPLAEARAQALENRRIARAGGDPLQARQAESEIPTFAEAARRVHQSHAPTWRNPKHAAQWIATLETYAFPKLGALKVGDITSADVLAVLEPIWTTKAETARRVRQRIGAVMEWTIAQGWRVDNPARDVGRALPKVTKAPQRRKALAYDKVADCLNVVEASDAGMATKLALRFLVLTAARSGEVRGTRWSEIDLTTGTWTVPASRMKAKRLHRVPLSPQALAVLRQAQALSAGSELVFPGARAGRPLSDMTLLKLVRSLGFDTHIHGFRTSFRTWAQERTSFAREVAEAALAHSVGDVVERAYARSDVFEKRRRLMETWADYLDAEHGKVVSIAAGGAVR